MHATHAFALNLILLFLVYKFKETLLYVLVDFSKT